MRATITNIICAACTMLKLCFMKLFHGSRLRFSSIVRFSPNVSVEMSRGGEMQLGKGVRVHSGSKIKVRKGAKLTFGDHVRINYNCLIGCHEAITIGANTGFGPNVVIYDHDHDVHARERFASGKFVSKPIVIGENCWIGANTIILKGAHIGNHCVIAAGSVVRGDIPSHHIVYQKRTTDCVPLED